MRKQPDEMIRAIAAGGMVRAFAVNATRLCERARRVQQSLPAASAALGRLLSAAVMMAGAIKEGERISLRVVGDGPVGVVFAQAYPDGRARGFIANPQVNPPSKEGKLDVGRAVGAQGYLYVVRDLHMRDPYVGSVPLQSGEIGDDLVHYYAVSEQQPSAIGLGVLVEPNNAISAAGGYFVQLLPGADEDVVSRLEENISAAPRPSDLIITLRNPTAILDVLLDGLAWQPLETITPRYFCGCNRRKSRAALHALGSGELREMILEGEPARVSCDFCGRAYAFTPEELAKVLAEKGNE